MQIAGKILLSIFIYGAIGLTLALAMSPVSKTSEIKETIGLILYHLLVGGILYGFNYKNLNNIKEGYLVFCLSSELK